ncbi:MAG: hypothetical protein EB120_13255 [Proteobacteria bacterium]|nr:hypothetical protein [Pseudomonadota bacterium]NDG28127.1 hypothetical protein [Pseudomonadota bacterium]
MELLCPEYAQIRAGLSEKFSFRATLNIPRARIRVRSYRSSLIRPHFFGIHFAILTSGTMRRQKKTKRGVEIKSTLGARQKNKTVWWLAVIQNRKIQVFSYCAPSKHLESVVCYDELDNKDAVSSRLRDSAGRSFESFSKSHGGHGTGHPRHGLSSRLSPKERLSQILILKASQFLEANRRKNEFSHLGIFSEPHLLGTFRSKLSRLTNKKVKLEIAANYSWLSSAQLEQKLLSYLPEPIPRAPRFFPKSQGAWQVPKFITKERSEG